MLGNVIGRFAAVLVLGVAAVTFFLLAGHQLFMKGQYFAAVVPCTIGAVILYFVWFFVNRTRENSVSNAQTENSKAS